MDEPPPKCRFLDVAYSGKRLSLSLQRCFEEHLGLRLRRREARRRLKTYLRHLGSMTWSELEVTFTIEQCDARIAEINSVLKDIDEAFDAIAERPLPSGMVEQALGITARERLRWTKDGRLRTTGIEIIRRNQRVALNLYSVKEIERLLHDPHTIDSWRDTDRLSPSN